MQKYKEIQAQEYVNSSRTTINENLQTLQSHNSGTAFPTSNLFEGMKCYRTDTKKTYTLKGNNTWSDDSLASKLAAAVTIALSGGATGTATSFDGSGNITIPVTSIDGSKVSGTVNKATKDSADQQINTTYIKSLSVNGKTITITKGNNTTSTITTQDTTYSNMTGASSSAAGKAGLVPAPAAGNQAKFLRGDGTWQTPTDTNTHYTSHLYAGSGTAANASTTNGNTKITVADDSTVRNSVTIKGTGATTVTSDANGVVTVNSTNTTYSTGTASASGITKLYTGVGDNTDGSMTQKAIKAIVGTGGGIIAASLAANGYIKFANGLILQWGVISSSTETWKAVTFPIAFPNNCFFAVPINNFITDNADVSSDYPRLYGITAKNVSKTGCTIFISGAWKNRAWLAIGK